MRLQIGLVLTVLFFTFSSFGSDKQKENNWKPRKIANKSDVVTGRLSDDEIEKIVENQDPEGFVKIKKQIIDDSIQLAKLSNLKKADQIIQDQLVALYYFYLLQKSGEPFAKMPPAYKKHKNTYQRNLKEFPKEFQEYFQKQIKLESNPSNTNN